ncbi:MAG: hypothetical protein U0640_04595 [Phycisphaerales bacterium]
MDDNPSFLIVLTPSAIQQFSNLDASLRDEVRQHAAIVGEDPSGELVRQPARDYGEGVYAYEFVSDVVHGLTIRLVFSSVDFHARIARMIAIVQLYKSD